VSGWGRHSLAYTRLQAELGASERSPYNVSMRFTWDKDKRLTNIQKHGIDFLGAHMVFDGYTVTMEDDRLPYGAQHFVTLGFLGGRLVAVVHTEREDTIRIISIRKATRYEQRLYVARLTD
jgi:uncharacterized DUF497 family protein